jgi:hypothetical protein
MRWKNLKEISNITNKPLIKPKARYKIRNISRFNKKITLAATCLLFIIFFSAVIGGFGSNKNFVHASSVQGRGVGIYWDQACTNRTLLLSWGSVDAGSKNNLTVYVRNECNSDVSLSLSASNWEPLVASSYISLNWNYTSQVFKTNEVVPIELTLTLSPTIVDITDFSFETIITTIGK